MSFFKKIGRALKKALPFAAVAAPFIPGVGGLISAGVSKLGSLWGGDSGGSSAQSFPVSSGSVESRPLGQAPNPIADSGTNWSAALGSVASGAAQYFGQRQANSANAQMAQRQMDFQEQQTSTAYQRATADMRAAGLNPMLAYSQGGAASGAGASSTMSNEVGAGANTALSAYQTIQELEQRRIAMDQMRAQTGLIAQQTELERANTFKTIAQTPGAQHDSVSKMWDAERVRLGFLFDSDTYRDRADTLHSAAQGAKAKSQQAEYDALLAKYGLSKGQSESEFWSSEFGKKYPYLQAGGAVGRDVSSIVRNIVMPWR